jgi:hypothetical protein
MASLHNLRALILPEWRSGTPSCVLLSGARRAIPGPRRRLRKLQCACKQLDASYNPHVNSGYAKFGACAAAYLPVTTAS